MDEIYRLINNLYSNSVNLRRQSLVFLNNYLEKENVIKLIDKNSLDKKNGEVTWNFFFQHTIDTMIKETEFWNAKKVKTHEDNLYKFNIILETIFKNAYKKERLYLGTDEVLKKLILAIERGDVLHDSTVNICFKFLNDTVLNNSKYIFFIKDKYWSRLLKLSENLLNTVTNKDNILSLWKLYELFYKVLRSAPISYLPQYLAFILKLWQKDFDKKDVRLVINMFKATNITFKRLICEYREELCELGETISNYVYQIDMDIQHSYSNEIKNLIYEFFLYQMLIHHPLGVNETVNDLFLAKDLDLWRQCVKKLFQKIVRENMDSSEVHFRITSSYFTSEMDWPLYLKLSAFVLKQMVYYKKLEMDELAEIEEVNGIDGPTQPNKRICREINPHFIITEKLAKNQTWLKILTMYLETYEEWISEDDLIFLLKKLLSLPVMCKKQTILCLIQLLHIDTKYFINSSNDNAKQELWFNVWEIIVKNEPAAELNEVSNELLQRLIEEEKSINVKSLLLSFGTELTNCNRIKTIQCLLKHDKYNQKAHLIDDVQAFVNFKLNLMRILLSVTNQMCLENENINREWVHRCQLVVGINFKDFPQFVTDTTLSKSNCLFDEIEAIENCYLSYKFKTRGDMKKIKKDEHIDRKKKKEGTINETRIVDKQMNQEFNFLISKLSDALTKDLDKLNQFDKFKVCSRKTGFLLQLFTQMLDLGLIKDPTELNELHLAFGQLYYCCQDSLVNLINEKKSTNGFKEMMIVFKMFSGLYNQRLNVSIIDSLLKFTKLPTLNCLTSIFEIDNISDGNEIKRLSYDYLDERRLTVVEILKYKVLEPLCAYAFNQQLVRPSKRQEKLIEKALLAAEINDHYELHMYRRVLKSACACQLTFLNKLSKQKLFKVLIDIFNLFGDSSSVINLILDSFKGLYEQLMLDDMDDIKDMAFELLNRLFENRLKYSIDLYEKLMKTIDFILKIDVSQQCKNDAIWKCYNNYISDFSHRVRLAGVPFIFNVFQLDGITNNDKKQFLTCIIKQVDESFELSENRGDNIDNIKSLIASRGITCAFLYSKLSTISIYQSHILFQIFHLTYLNYIKKEIAIETLKLMESNNSDKKCLLKNNLNYILSKWFSCQMTLDQFPYNLFGYQTKTQLFLDFTQILLFQLFKHSKEEDLQDISCDIGATKLKQIINDHLGYIISRNLSWFDKNLFEVDSSASSQSTLNFLSQIYSKSDMESRIIEIIDDVYMNILSLLYDFEYFKNCFRPITNSLTSEHFNILVKKNLINFEQFDKMLKYLERICSTSSLVIYFAESRPLCFESILLRFVECINEDPSKIYLHLHHMKIFIDYLIDCIDHKSIDKHKRYLMENLTFTLLNLLKQYSIDLNITQIITQCLTQLFNVCIPKFPDVFRKFLNKFIIQIVQIISEQNGQEGSDADQQHLNQFISILELLIIKHNKYVYNSLMTLDPFPDDDPRFASIRDSYNRDDLLVMKPNQDELEKEILLFINVDPYEIDSNRYFSLRSLLKRLRTFKTKLNAMFNDLTLLNGFSEDFDHSLLHQLIYNLIILSKSQNQKVRMAVAECLGEIGPSDLTTIILKANDVTFADKHANESGVLLLTWLIIFNLSNLMYDANFDTRQAVCLAFREIFPSPFANLTIDKSTSISYRSRQLAKEQFSPYLHDRAQLKNDKIEIELKSKCVLEALESSFWMPNGITVQEHNNWVIQLSEKLLLSFVYPKFTSALIPIIQRNSEVGESLIPWLVEIFAMDKNCLQKISENLKMAFEKWFHGQQFHLRSLKLLLNIVYYNKLRADKSANPTKLELNYLYVAKAAQECSEYFISLYYIDLWCRTQIDWPNSIQSQQTILHHICLTSQHSNLIQEMLLKANNEIGDVDAIDGCGLLHHLNWSKRVEYYKSNEPYNYLLAQNNNLAHWFKKKFKNHHQSTNQFTQQITQVSLNVGDNELRQMSLNHESLYFSQQTEALRNNDDVILVDNNSESIQSINKSIEFYRQQLCDSLKSANLYLAANCLSTGEDQYECLWRLSQWNYKDNRSFKSEKFECDVNRFKYFAMKSLYTDRLTHFDDYIRDARDAILTNIDKSCTEVAKKFYKPLSELKMVQEIEDFYNYFITNKYDLNYLKQKWCNLFETNYLEFAYIEPILAQRLVLLDVALTTNRFDPMLKPNDFNQCKEFLIQLHIELISTARKHKNLNVAETALGPFIYNELDLDDLSRWRVKFEEAQIEWQKRDNKITAKQIILNLLNELNINPLAKYTYIHANALLLYGQWMMETLSGNPKKYFEQSLEICEHLSPENVVNFNTNNPNIKIDNYKALAKFAHAEYQQKKEFLNSPAYHTKLSFLKQSQEYLNMVKSDSLTKAEEKKLFIETSKRYQIEKNEIDQIKQFKNSYLQLALENYLKTLKTSDDHDLFVFHITSLLLENKNNIDMIKLLDEHFVTIPTYKFVAIFPQLTPHMSSNHNDPFSKLINALIEKCCIDHPHHTLPLVFGLVNASIDKDVDNTNEDQQQARTQQAKQLIENLSNTRVQQIVVQMSKLYLALIQFANYDLVKKCQKPDEIEKSIPTNLRINQIIDFNQINCPTIELRLKPNCNYENDVIGIQRYKNRYELVGGINSPKKISVLCSDGTTRTQLIKGLDDIRQDAVMQQVFTIINSLLKKSTNRQLRIRTYKVVPMTQKSGILEWCKNTMPLAHYLIGESNEKGAHEKYYPQDYPPNKCRSMLINVRTESAEKKLETYLKICENIRPAFHHFFLEKFSCTSLWWERRRAYTISVAVSSIVGYILGIGDRHPMNILIDKNTAELIHIDFGIAFEQGKMLPTPETVPFRLTRDIKDGMGISGVEGLFRKCCEKTLETLRENSDIILTILQVLLYDPLYMWDGICSKKAMAEQLDNQNEIRHFYNRKEDVNKTAETVLFKIMQKLKCEAENGVSGSVSVTGQVETLIQQAQDPDNLSRMFNGWQSYL